MLSPVKKGIGGTHFIIEDFNNVTDLILIIFEQERSKPKDSFHFLNILLLVEQTGDSLIDILSFKVLNDLIQSLRNTLTDGLLALILHLMRLFLDLQKAVSLVFFIFGQLFGIGKNELLQHIELVSQTLSILKPGKDEFQQLEFSLTGLKRG